MANHNEVAHAWAHQTGRQRKGFNMFYEGATIYSYGHHFPIATHTHDVDGRPVVLMTTAGYSVSTAKHKNYVSRAARHLDVIRVPCLKGPFTSAGQAYIDVERAALSWREKIAEALAKAGRARTNRAWYLSEAADLIEQHNTYARRFGLIGTRHFPYLLSLDTFGAQYAAMQEAIEQERAAAAERRRLADLAKARKDRGQLRDWLHGVEGVQAPRTMRPMVRVKGDTLQTTWGASVPLADALRVYERAKAMHATPREKPDDGLCDIVGGIGSFGDAYVSRSGAIRVGCHTIPFRYARVAACLAGLDRE